jgi:uncharacterized protein YjbJ (UPF0337 family)
MDENRIAETAKNIEGKVQEGLGSAAGDTDATFQGKVESAGDAVNAMKYASASVEDTISNYEDTISNYIENNPYKTVAIALGLGWLIGRSHRPF